MLHTTLSLMKEKRISNAECEHVRKHLGLLKEYEYNTKIQLTDILDICGFYTTLHSLRAVLTTQKDERDKIIRLLAYEYSEHVTQEYQNYCDSNKNLREIINLTSIDVINNTIKENELKNAIAATVDLYNKVLIYRDSNKSTIATILYSLNAIQATISNSNTHDSVWYLVATSINAIVAMDKIKGALTGIEEEKWQAKRLKERL